MKKTLILLSILTSITLIACQKSANKTNDQDSITPTNQSSTQTSSPSVSAKDLLDKFFQANANYQELTASLKPTDADYASYFDASVVEKAKTGYTPLWDTSPVFQPQTGETDLLINQATTEEIKNQTGGGTDFPGGYAEIIDKIKPGQTIYRFKFVKPGETLGTAFDGLVYINNHWVIFPKPWKALK